MGANAQTTVPTFTAGQVLTADQQNQSARTGVPVFASTVDRDAAFGGAGEKTLAEGQLCYIEGTGLQTYNAAGAWVTWGTSNGLTLITTQTVGAGVASVTVTNAFSSTYDNYRIVMNNGSASGVLRLTFQLSGITTGYYGAFTGTHFSTNAVTGVGINNAATVTHAGFAASPSAYLSIDVFSPNLAEEKGFFCSQAIDGSTYGTTFAQNTSTTQATGFVIATSTGTISNNVIYVYGYAK